MLQPISEIASRPVNWLWPGRLALGKLSILDGDPGLGKSLLSLDLAARLTSSGQFAAGACAHRAPDRAPTYNTYATIGVSFLSQGVNLTLLAVMGRLG